MMDERCVGEGENVSLLYDDDDDRERTSERTNDEVIHI